MDYSMMIDSKMIRTMLVLLFNCRTGDNISPVQRAEAKDNVIRFQGLSCDIPQSTKSTLQFSKGDTCLSLYNSNTEIKEKACIKIVH